MNRQEEAYHLTMNIGLTQTEAGEKMGITQQGVARLLSRLRDEAKHTQRQEQAYRHQHIEGLSQRATAALMGITVQAVSGLVSRLIKHYPSLRHSRKHPKTIHIKDWNAFNQTKIIDKY